MRAKLKMLTTIPVPSATTKKKSVCLKKSLNRPLKNNAMALPSNDFMALISLSKTPVIRATVPPDTPGITLAAPIAIPFRA